MNFYPVYRKDVARGEYLFPLNVCKTMAPQIYQYRRVIGHRFKLRHVHGRKQVRDWIEAFRRDLQACGWSANARLANAKLGEALSD